MKRKRDTEKQIISILKEHEAGISIPDLSRQHGIARNTLYGWKSKFGVMQVSDARKLRELVAENARSKRLYADTMPGNHGLKELLSKKAEARSAAAALMQRLGFGQAAGYPGG